MHVSVDCNWRVIFYGIFQYYCICERVAKEAATLLCIVISPFFSVSVPSVNQKDLCSIFSYTHLVFLHILSTLGWIFAVSKLCILEHTSGPVLWCMPVCQIMYLYMPVTVVTHFIILTKHQCLQPKNERAMTCVLMFLLGLWGKIFLLHQLKTAFCKKCICVYIHTQYMIAGWLGWMSLYSIQDYVHLCRHQIDGLIIDAVARCFMLVLCFAW